MRVEILRDEQGRPHGLRVEDNTLGWAELLLLTLLHDWRGPCSHGLTFTNPEDAARHAIEELAKQFADALEDETTWDA